MERAARWIFRCASSLACVGTLLPMAKSGRWWVRSWDFPRAQVATVAAMAAGLGLLQRKQLGRGDHWLLYGAQAAALVQLLHVVKYTRLFPKQVMGGELVRDSASFSLLAANVRTRNRNPGPLLKIIKDRKPDLVLLLEPDRWWAEQLSGLHKIYPHRLLQPQDNTYGILLYSTLKLLDPEIRYLVQHDVPSLRTRLRLRDGQEAWFFGLHPRPPVRGNMDGVLELEGSRPRDAELVMVATEIRELDEPVVVAGDFNDVAWSHTTRRFQRLGRLLDPRVGRGLYNTFHAQNRLFRFPLDHLFISEHFRLVNFHREPAIGSDHFPIFARLELHPAAVHEQDPPTADREDFKEAERTVREAAEQVSAS